MPTSTIHESLQLIADDAKADAATLDGTPLTGLAIGTIFGQNLAMIHALAEACIEQEKRIASLQISVTQLSEGHI